jgi:AraC family transcriptional regulator
MPDGQPLELTSRRLRHADLGEFALREQIYMPHLRMPRHGHEPAYISAYLSGGCTERVGSHTDSPKVGSIVFHPAQEEHEVRFDGAATRIFNVEIRPSLLTYAAQCGARLKERRRLDSPQLRWLVARLYNAYSSEPLASKLALQGILYELLAEIGELPPEVSGNASLSDRAEEYLRANFHHAIGLQHVARELGVHATYLARAFRAASGRTLGDRLREIRIEHATKLLAGSELSLTEVAVECGFADHSHLTRTFRAHAGITPAAYRKAYRPRLFSFQG